jgi:hypothetical protein
MSAGMLVGCILGVLLVGLLLVGVTIMGTYTSAHDSAVNAETTITKLDKDSENVLSTVTLTIQETAGVASMYAGDLKDTLRTTFQSRNGPDGNKAVVQWIKEQNPTLNSKLYLKIQDVIEGGRKEFQIAQSRKLEACGTYENMLGWFWRGKLLSFAGFPRLDLKKSCQVVSDSKTAAAFDTGKQEPIKFGKQQ